ncbi:MAG: oxygenase MpaB family protein [Flavobacteriaceae bacterium]
MEYFVEKHSVVRQIWGKDDTIMFIFAGAAAEFALNKAVDWLYFTGRLPADPLGRLFSTVSYARNIVFAGEADALKTIDAIAAVHTGVEEKRGMKIPQWAYRDVLYMLIDYSIRSFETLERTLSTSEKEEVFHTFHKVGTRMGLEGLPATFEEWKHKRTENLKTNLQYSAYTADLFGSYKNHLGVLRYIMLLKAQTLVVPEKVLELLKLKKQRFLKPLLGMYKLGKTLYLDRLFKAAILPVKYQKEIRAWNQSADAHL